MEEFYGKRLFITKAEASSSRIPTTVHLNSSTEKAFVKHCSKTLKKYNGLYDDEGMLRPQAEEFDLDPEATETLDQAMSLKSASTYHVEKGKCTQGNDLVLTSLTTQGAGREAAVKLWKAGMPSEAAERICSSTSTDQVSLFRAEGGSLVAPGGGPLGLVLCRGWNQSGSCAENWRKATPESRNCPNVCCGSGPLGIGMFVLYKSGTDKWVAEGADGKTTIIVPLGKKAQIRGDLQMGRRSCTILHLGKPTLITDKGPRPTLTGIRWLRPPPAVEIGQEGERPFGEGFFIVGPRPPTSTSMGNVLQYFFSIGHTVVRSPKPKIDCTREEENRLVGLVKCISPPNGAAKRVLQGILNCYMANPRLLHEVAISRRTNPVQHAASNISVVTLGPLVLSKATLCMFKLEKTYAYLGSVKRKGDMEASVEDRLLRNGTYFDPKTTARFLVYSSAGLQGAEAATKDSIWRNDTPAEGLEMFS